MSYKHATKRIDEAIELGVLGIGITGGEPSLNPRYLDIIKYAISKNVAVSFISNGANVKRADLEQFAFYPKLSFWFSFDSHIPEINDYFRGEGAFDRTLKYLNLVKS